jgi:hypothetical protein
MEDQMRFGSLFLASLLFMTMAASADARRRPYTGGEDCIDVKSIRAESAETEDRLIFHSGGSQAYINHLPAACGGLLGINNLARLTLQPKSDRLCVGDKVIVSGSGLLSSVGIGDDNAANCMLGRFEPVGEMTLSEGFRR